MKFFEVIRSGKFIQISESEYNEALQEAFEDDEWPYAKKHQSSFQCGDRTYIALDPTKPIGDETPKSASGLKSQNAYWDTARPEIIEAVKSNPKDLDKETLEALVLELDRRFMQLWDKVSFEREHGLVDYSKLKPFSKR